MLLDNQKVNEEVNKLNNKAIVKTNKKISMEKNKNKRKLYVRKSEKRRWFILRLLDLYCPE